jgi:hypothetical protein
VFGKSGNVVARSGFMIPTVTAGGVIVTPCVGSKPAPTVALGMLRFLSVGVGAGVGTVGAGIVGGEIVGAIPAAAKLAFISSMFICGICTVCPPGKVIERIGNIGPIPFIAIGNRPLIISYEGLA